MIKIETKKIIPSLFLLGTICAFLSSCYYDNEEELYPDSGNCDTTSAVYDGDIESIVLSQCATTGCHVAGGSGNGIFESYSGIKAKVDNGSFRQQVVINRDMPPTGPLSNCNIQRIEAWLAAGAPQN